MNMKVRVICEFHQTYILLTKLILLVVLKFKFVTLKLFEVSIGIELPM
jgi:hypothetical protein